jgi:hypothetical protein
MATIEKGQRLMSEDSINRPIVTRDDAARAVDSLPPDQRELAEELIGTARVAAASTVTTGDGPWYLSAVSVRGHAGIGQQPVELSLTPARGLTIVSARNGTGKTSFVDGLRLGLGATLSSDQGVLAENIHWAQRSITATVTNGARDVDIVSDQSGARWAEATGDFTAIPSEWKDAFARYLPVLLHHELSPVIANPGGKLHDFLKAGLALDVLERLLALAGEVKKQGAQAAQKVKPTWERAPRLLKAAGLDDLADDVTTATSTPASATVRALRAGLSSLPTAGAARPAVVSPWRVDDADLATIVSQVEAWRSSHDQAISGAMEAQQVLAQLLDAHGTYIDELVGSDTCPVCRTAGAGWQTRARIESERLDGLLTGQSKARSAAEGALQRLASHLPPALSPTTAEALRVAPAADVEQRIAEWNALRARMSQLSVQTTDVETLRSLARDSAQLAAWYDQRVAAIDARHDSVVAERAKARDAVNEWLDQVDGFSKDLDRGAAAGHLEETVKTWIKQTRSIIFEPIGEEIERMWSALNPDSDLVLGGVDLVGGVVQQRRVSLDITLDGAKPPHGVDGTRAMSAGQRNALSLAAYLPRAVQAGTPFGFLILDDPIHAFDTWRVRYLAKELIKLAESFQVVVFTHDDRLWREVRAMDGRPSHIRMERLRGEHSRVVVKDITRPGELLLDDLDHILQGERKASIGTDEARTAMTLALCRQALDVEIVTQMEILGRRLGKHDDDLEHDLAGVFTTQQQLDLLNDYARQANRSHVDYGRFRPTIDALNAGAHGQTVAQSLQRVSDARLLVAMIAAVS